jgi:YidC/Oxa1 family membrane protein insertase
MDFLISVSLSRPDGFWAGIIFAMESVVGNYALALILITVAIRIVLMPFDFINKHSTKKMTRKQNEMRPELEKINKAYANNKDMLNQKTMELYKKHNFNVTGTCGVMLVYMIVTMFVFFSLFATLNEVSAYKIAEQYAKVSDTYYATYAGEYATSSGAVSTEDENYDKSLREWVNSYLLKTEEEVNAMSSEDSAIYTSLVALKDTADANANKTYDKTQSSFLWIKSIWRSDTMWTSPTLPYSNFINDSQLDKKDVSRAEYNLVMREVIEDNSGMNGFFILAVLSIATQFASIKFNSYLSRKKAIKQGIPVAEDPNSNKSMSIIMPVIMGIFAIFYNAAFGIYLVASGLVSFITGTISTLVVDNIDVITFKKNRDKKKASYSRK